MKLEEIRELSDEELGKRLAEAAGMKTKLSPPSFKKLLYERAEGFWYPVTDFCRKLDHISAIEKFVVEKVGLGNYGKILAEVYHPDTIKSCVGFHGAPFFAIAIGVISQFSARQRAEAALLALEAE